MSTWRETSRAIIQDVVNQNPDAPKEEQRKMASKACPFRRQGDCYKAWLKAMNDVFGPSERKLKAQEKQREIQSKRAQLLIQKLKGEQQ